MGDFRLSTKHVNVANVRDAIYLRGDEDTDGSLRVIPSVDGQAWHFQKRIDGQWEDGGTQVATGSVRLGRDTSLEVTGRYLKSSAVSDGLTSITPHGHYDNTGSQPPHYLEQQYIRLKQGPSYPTPDERVAKTFENTIPSGSRNLLITQAYFRTGATGGTAPVTFTVRKDSPTGQLFFQKTYPTSTFATPNSEVHCVIPGDIQIDAGVATYLSLESTDDFSLEYNNTFNLWWMSLDYRRVQKTELLMDDLILTNDMEIIFTDGPQIIYTSQFV